MAESTKVSVPAPDDPRKVAPVVITLQDNDAEGTYPTDRKLWPTVAHAPKVLSFTAAASSFKALSEADRRSTFASMAQSLTGLGKGARITMGKSTDTVTDRAIAYGDAVMMGERATKRAGMYGSTVDASSCGMFVRTLLKMIGAHCFMSGSDTFAAEYVWGKVFAELQAVADANDGAARVKPGDTEPATNQDGQPVTRPKMPKLGDIVVINADTGPHGHVFVITSVKNPNAQVSATPGGDTKVLVFSSGYFVAQAGQSSTERFTDDGSCMATNAGGFHVLDTTWVWDQVGAGARSVKYWIDIAKLGTACDDGALIKPVRNLSWTTTWQ